MIKLSRTGITALKRQYRSVLLKCLLINAGILLAAGSAMAVDPTITLPGTAGAVNGVSGAGSDVTYTIVEGTTETTHAIATVDKITEDISALITTKETNISGTMGFDITKNPANTSEPNSLVSKLTGPNAGDQTSIVGAINAVDNAVGALGSLTTDAKTNLVAAINEVDAHADTNTANIGTLGSLTTDAKTNLVAAINEIDAHADTNTANIGTLGSLTTDVKTSLVAAINEIDAHADANATAIANAINGTTKFTGLTMDNNADTPGTTTANKIDDGTYNDTAATTLATNATVNAAITKERTATATLTNKTIDADDNTISDLTTANLKSGVLQTTVRAADTATDTNLVSELAVRTALDTKTDLVDTNTAGNKAKVDVDATNKQITMKVTDTDGSTPLAGLTVNGTNQSVDVTGGLKVGAASAITGSAGSLDMGANALTNVASITTTGNATIGGSADIAGGLTAGASDNFTVDSSGAITKVAGITSQAPISINNTATTKNTFEVSSTGLKLGTDVSSDSTTTFSVNSTNGNTSIGGTLGVTGNTTIDGTLKVGAASAITGTSGTLNMGNNALTGVKGLTVTDGSNNATLSVNAKGFATDDKDIDVGKGSLNSKTLNVGSASAKQFSVDESGNVITSGTLKSGAATVASLNIGTTGKGIDDDGDATLKSVTLGSTTVDKIATAAVAAGAGATDTLATTASVLLSAQNGTYTAGAGATNVTGTSTLGAATTTLDKLMGTVSGVTVNGYETADASKRTLAGSVTKLNSNMSTVLGGVYKADGSYDNTQLLNSSTPNGFEAGATSLTDALKKYAENVQASTGTTFAADGTFTNGYTTTTVGADIATTDTFVTAISKVNTNLENILTTAGTEVDSAKVDVQWGTSSPDKTLNNVLGNGTYANNMTPAYGAITEGTNITTAISQVASNIGAAVTDGTRTTGKMLAANTVNQNLTALDTYLGGDVTQSSRTTGKMLAANTVKANLEALDAAIGTDTDLTTATATIVARGANNGVVVGNSVNANIATLNSAVGDLTKLHATYTAGASIGNAITNGGTGITNNVVDALNNIDATLGTIHGLKAKLAAAGKDYGNLAAGTTVEDHLTSLDAAIGDRSQFATGRYVASSNNLADATMALDKGLSDLADDVRDFKKEFKSGMAQMAAMSALVPNARAHGNTQISVGTGAYNGQTAAAVGGFHWVNDNLLLNAGVSYGNSNDVAYRAGLTWSW